MKHVDELEILEKGIQLINKTVIERMLCWRLERRIL